MYSIHTIIILIQFFFLFIFFIIKMINKETRDRTRKRHPNIDKEIMMEKRVSNFIYLFFNILCLCVLLRFLFFYF
jgi:uncharacterized membrane protein